ncbi:hypothetical protein FACS1894184_04800 [Clostridia bacterium]|nr:hypothetical protein FACS1894184_04800 [Clostridia bacterium]
MDSIGEGIKQERKRKNISQQAIASRLGITQGAVSEWERDGKRPSVENLLKLADLFGVTLDYLCFRTNNPLSLIKNDTPYKAATPFEKRC